MELDDYSQDLQFISEYQLTKEPLRIDLVIIKKTRDIVIEKNIASVFRKDNIVEYKSPRDYISVEDYYVVYGYACLYKSLKKLDIREMTLTFAGSHYPRDLLAHLDGQRGYTVEERWPGIYIVSGDIMPIQIIDNRRLSEEENIWLKDLDDGLKALELRRITDEARRRGKAARIGAYLDVILRANKESLKEMMNMSDSVLTLDMIFEEAGLVAKWEARGEAKGEARGEARGIAKGEARGEERKAAEIAKNMIMNGFTVEQTAVLSGLDVAKIKTLSDAG
jgi:hypothetical protein